MGVAVLKFFPQLRSAHLTISRPGFPLIVVSGRSEGLGGFLARLIRTTAVTNAG